MPLRPCKRTLASTTTLLVLALGQGTLLAVPAYAVGEPATRTDFFNRSNGQDLWPGTVTVLPVLANDTAGEFGPLRVVALSPVKYESKYPYSVDEPPYAGDLGEVSLDHDGTVRYHAPADIGDLTRLETSFTYTAQDTAGRTVQGLAYLAVLKDARTYEVAPGDDRAITDEGAPVTVPVLANDTYRETTEPYIVISSLSAPQPLAAGDVQTQDHVVLPAPDELAVAGTSDPANGTARVNPDGTVTYTPDAGFTGTETFTYTALHPSGTSAPGTVTVDVVGETVPPAAPTAAADALTVAQDTPGTVDVVLNDTAFDGGALTVVSTSPGAHGTTVVTDDNKVTYTPAPGYSGPDTFTYVVRDSVGGETTGTVDVTVTPAPVVTPPAAPTAAPDALTVAQDTSGTVDVVLNDTAFDNGPLTVVSVEDGAHGTTVVTEDNKVTYTPAPGYSGPDSFEYTIRDSVGGETTGTVDVTVTPAVIVTPPAPPTAAPDTLTVAQDSTGAVEVVLNDTAFDNGPLTVVRVGPGTHGTTVVNDDNTVTYTPAPGYSGTDTFTYGVRDSAGAETTGTVEVTVTPSVVVTPPVEEPTEPVDEPTPAEPVLTPTEPTEEPEVVLAPTEPTQTPVESGPTATPTPVTTQESAPAPTPTAKRTLPHTGSELGALALLGSALTAMGGATVAGLRRRRPKS